MKIAHFALATSLSAFAWAGCVQEGHSADCGAEDRDDLEDAGCLTPIGGTCLTEEEFKKDRPATRENSRGDEITVEEDWAEYQEERPECGFSAGGAGN